MSKRSPKVVIFAGPNGAGTCTCVPELLRGRLKVNEFVNADLIALGISGFAPEAAVLQAGRVILSRLRFLASTRVDLAFETRLESRTLAPRIRELMRSGYRSHLVFLWLSDLRLAIERVSERVRSGGHHVPEETIRRRYVRGVESFFALCRQMVT
jgi:predicted ABC-type ATPase